MARARRRSKRKGDEEGGEDWMVTYADAITLLMAFFVMLVSFSKIELPVFEQVQAGIAEQIGGATSRDTPIFDLEQQMRDILSEQSDFPPDQITVGFDDEGVVLDFASGYFFQPGTTDMTPEAGEILRAVYQKLNEEPFDVFKIDVQGHTSDKPPDSILYPTNWELSAGQAARVVREFVELGMKPEWLNASGFADTEPKVPNLDLTGAPIAANRAKNERISLILYP
jgi:chemotaxis protein MotB